MSSPESAGAQESEPRKAGHTRRRTAGDGPSPSGSRDQRSAAHAHAVPRACTVARKQWAGTLREAVPPRRRTDGVKPGAVQAARPVTHEGDAESGVFRPRLVV